MRNKLISERGDTNVVVLALALPLLVLIGTAAMDIVRFPIVKQQMLSNLHAGFDQLSYDEEENINYSDVATGLNWCVFLTSDHPRYNCAPCLPTDPRTCSDASDLAVSVAATRAADLIKKEFQVTGSGILAHDDNDVTAYVQIYNLLTEKSLSESPIVTGYELVSAAQAGPNLVGFDSEQKAKDLLHAHFLVPSYRPVGHSIGHDAELPDRFFDVPVVVLMTAVRVHNIFSFSAELSFSVEESNPNETVLFSSLVRPMARGIRLSGPINDSP